MIFDAKNWKCFPSIFEFEGGGKYRVVNFLYFLRAFHFSSDEARPSVEVRCNIFFLRGSPVRFFSPAWSLIIFATALKKLLYTHRIIKLFCFYHAMLAFSWNIKHACRNSVEPSHSLQDLNNFFLHKWVPHKEGGVNTRKNAKIDAARPSFLRLQHGRWYDEFRMGKWSARNCGRVVNEYQCMNSIFIFYRSTNHKYNMIIICIYVCLFHTLII